MTNPVMASVAEFVKTSTNYSVSFDSSSVHIYGYWGRWCELACVDGVYRLRMVFYYDLGIYQGFDLAELQLSDPKFFDILLRCLKRYIGFWSVWRYLFEPEHI